MTVELGAVLFRVAFWLYLGATICYVVYLFNRQTAVGQGGTALLGVGCLLQTASLGVRMAAVHHPPFLNLYEYGLSVLWGFVIVYLVVEWKSRSRDLGVFVVPLLTLFVFLANRLPTESNPTMPALRSAWRVPHICTAIFAYSAFAVAFGFATMYLIRDWVGDNKKSFWVSRLPALHVLDRLAYRTTSFGFMMQTALLITGAIWAQFAWGRYWGWDPKETWALITWLIYAAYLHTRVTLGWRGRKSAFTLIFGFIAVIVTLLGVNYMGGLHSYGSG
jgi:cytochrome c-type biogenesis protein CcsB